MTDIFISYAKENFDVVQRLATELGKTQWTVFWDRQIPSGAQWNAEIQTRIQQARCVVVLWSKASAQSFWVCGEAAVAHGRQVYLPFRIDGHELPDLFKSVQATSIEKWVQTKDPSDLKPLIDTVQSRIGAQQMHGNLEVVDADQPVEEKHLHLVHSCWRVSKESKAPPFALMPYQIHVVLFGHPSALDRVERVEYMLPGYPAGHQHVKGGPRDRLFELMELANGFSVVQANVFMTRPQRVLRLSRFVNMSESGPRLLEDFVGRSPFKSNLQGKLTG